MENRQEIWEDSMSQNLDKAYDSMSGHIDRMQDRWDQYMDDCKNVVDNNFAKMANDLLGLYLGLLIGILSIPIFAIIAVIIRIICAYFGI